MALALLVTLLTYIASNPPNKSTRQLLLYLFYRLRERGKKSERGCLYHEKLNLSKLSSPLTVLIAQTETVQGVFGSQLRLHVGFPKGSGQKNKS